MAYKLPSLKALHAFEAAARLGSFTEAAVEMSLTPGAIGYQVKQLETALSTTLFERQTRQIVLTIAGASLFRVTHRVFAELEQEIRTLTRDSENNTLTVGVSTFFATRWLSQRLGHFMNAHPDITVRLHHSVNDPDFALNDVDLAIRWGAGNWDDCHADSLIRVPLVAACAPRTPIDRSMFNSFSDLKNQTLLCDQTAVDNWGAWLSKAGLCSTILRNKRIIVDANVRLQAAIDGQGLVLTNIPFVHNEFQQNKLVQCLDVQLDDLGYHLVHRRSLQLSRAVGLFREWLLGEARTFLGAHEMSAPTSVIDR